MIKGVDTAHKLNSDEANALSQCGVSFVGRYLVPNASNTEWKALTEQEANAIRSNGLAVLLLWEIETSRAKRGAEIGEADGKRARQLAEGMCIPSTCAVYFCVDYDAPQTDYQFIEEYLYAAKQAVAPYKCGVYGKADLINSVKADCYMQCVAWSYGVISNKANVYQYQWQKGNEALEIKSKTGVDVDMDRCEDMWSAGMWMPNTENEDAEVIVAHKWCVDNKIVDDTMRDVSQYEIMMYRYHKAFSA